MFASLAVPNYRIYFTGMTVSNMGQWMARTAQSWLVLTVLTDHSATALGTVTALQFLQALHVSGQPVSEFVSCCRQYPQELINVAVPHSGGVKERIMADETVWAQVREREAALAGEGRILLRPSGTEALIRVMVEAKTVELAHEVATDLADFIKKLV